MQIGFKRAPIIDRGRIPEVGLDEKTSSVDHSALIWRECLRLRRKESPAPDVAVSDLPTSVTWNGIDSKLYSIAILPLGSTFLAADYSGGRFQPRPAGWRRAIRRARTPRKAPSSSSAIWKGMLLCEILDTLSIYFFKMKSLVATRLRHPRDVRGNCSSIHRLEQRGAVGLTSPPAAARSAPASSRLRGRDRRGSPAPRCRPEAR